LLLSHRRLFAVIAILAVGVCVYACGRQERPNTPIKMRIGIGIPKRGTPGSGLSSVIGSLVSEPWLGTRTDGKQSERLMSAFTVDETGTKVRLTVRPNVLFQDGTPLTADLASEALKKSIADKEALSFTSIEAVRVLDPRTIEIDLKSPNSFLLSDLSLVLVRKPGRPKIGAGPFRVVSQDGQQAVLAAFPRYYRGRPQIDEIDITTYPTQRAAWAALMRGEIDMLYEVSREATDFVRAESSVRTFDFPRAYYIPLVFNVRREPLRSVKIRQAINEALDKAVLVAEGLNGQGSSADGPILRGHWAYTPPPQPFNYNLEVARTLIESSGLAQPPGDGRPGRISFECLVFADDSRFERLAMLVQKQLADVDIEMKLVPLPQDKLEERLGSGDFDAYLFEMFGRSLSYSYELWHSHVPARNNTGYTAADAVLDRMREAHSDPEMKTGVAEFERILHDDPPAAFIAWQRASRAVSTRFDVLPERDRDILSNVWQWRQVEPTALASR
jgi:peptide/nickel transport system substrate-binding protein